MNITSLLDKPVDPHEMLEVVKEDRNTMSGRQMVSGSKTKELRECWVAATFGIGYEKFAGPCKIVVLSGTNFPDFQLIIDKKSFGFETVMVLKEGRKPGDEYREIEETIEDGGIWMKPVSDGEMTENELSLPKRVREAIQSKLSKYGHGSKSVNLCIYLNIFAPNVNINSIREACKGLEDSFESIWLLSGHHIGTLFISEETYLVELDGFGAYETDD